MATKVTYLDNSGFMVEGPDVILIFDYFRDPAHEVKKALSHDSDRPVVFFVSHRHPDHFNPEIFNLAQNRHRVYVISNDVVANDIRDDVPVEWMSAGDVAEGLPGDIRVRAFGSTDAGVSYLVTMPDGFRIFHAGDLNYWHWKDESTPAEVEREHNRYTVILNRIASEVPEVDVAFFPVDTRLGADCQAGAVQFLSAIKVADFFPMHFKGEFDKACDFSAWNLPEAVVARTKLYCLHTPGDSETL